MVETREADDKTIDPKNGYCSQTRIYHSLRPPVSLPPLSQPLSITEFALSLLHQSSTAANVSTTPFLIEAATGHQLLYADFIRQTRSLSLSLQSHFPSLSKNDVAFILSPPSLHVPIVYFSLLSIGVVVSPANPLSSPAELTHLLQLTKPFLAFATSATAHKLPPSLPVILLDSPLFLDMLSLHTPSASLSVSKLTQPSGGLYTEILTPSMSRSTQASRPRDRTHDKILTSSKSSKSSQLSSNAKHVIINQLDTAAILYSSGTTGRVKGVELTHRNLIAVTAGMYDSKNGKDNELKGVDVDVAVDVSLFTLPLFHVFGFFMLIRAAALGETLVLMERFDFEKMLKAVKKYKVTYMPVSPPLVVAMAKSELVGKYDISSLQVLGCGGAPLGKEVSERFKARFPNVDIIQGYGLTETSGSATRMIGPEDSARYGSAGRLAENTEAKIVDPESGEALPPGQRGELWLRGPTIMKGYVGDDKATAATLDSEGWLRTGDLCYFDSDGFIFIVDRLKELIKYKAYQVPPAELEHLLQSIPEIADAAVIPYPDEEAGQIPMAYIVRRPGSNISATEVMDFVAKQVAPYKKIRRVAFINAIPKSPAGKILRRELVNHAVSGASAKL